jgi:hypothetical protein
MMKKAKRTDRNQIIYQITCQITGETYIGMTVKTGGIKKSLARRWYQHVNRAKKDNKDWALYEALRAHPFKKTADVWIMEAIEIVRGKVNAHRREMEIVTKMSPSLNTAKY